jgi:hypothetical protein
VELLLHSMCLNDWHSSDNSAVRTVDISLAERSNTTQSCYFLILYHMTVGAVSSLVIYLSTAIGLTPGGSSTVHIYTQTIHRRTQITSNLEEYGPCPVFASFTLTFALQLRKKH